MSAFTPVPGLDVKVRCGDVPFKEYTTIYDQARNARFPLDVSCRIIPVNEQPFDIVLIFHPNFEIPQQYAEEGWKLGLKVFADGERKALSTSSIQIRQIEQRFRRSQKRYFKYMNTITRRTRGIRKSVFLMKFSNIELIDNTDGQGRSIEINRNVGSIQLEIQWKRPYRTNQRDVNSRMQSQLNPRTGTANENQQTRRGSSADPYERDNSVIRTQKMLRSEAAAQGKSCYVSKGTQIKTHEQAKQRTRHPQKRKEIDWSDCSRLGRKTWWLHTREGLEGMQVETERNEDVPPQHRENLELPHGLLANESNHFRLLWAHVNPETRRKIMIALEREQAGGDTAINSLNPDMNSDCSEREGDETDTASASDTDPVWDHEDQQEPGSSSDSQDDDEPESAQNGAQSANLSYMLSTFLNENVQQSSADDDSEAGEDVEDGDHGEGVENEGEGGDDEDGTMED